MQIQINTDHNIKGNERLVNFYTSEIHKELNRFDQFITRIEVHFGDENSEKFGKNDKKCLIEARIAKKDPIAVTSNEESIEKAFYTALDKIKRVLTSTHDKMRAY